MNTHGAIIDKKKVIDSVITMFPLLQKDHFLYSTLDRYNWDVSLAIDIFQKRHITLENEQRQIEKKLEIEKEERLKEEEKKKKERKMVDSLKEVFGDSFKDEHYLKIIRDYQYNSENAINYFIRELELRNKKSAEEERLHKIRDEATKQEAEIRRRAEEQRKAIEEELRLKSKKEEEMNAYLSIKAREEERLKKQIDDEREQRARQLEEEKKNLEMMLEEQKKRLNELMEEKVLDEQKKKEYVARINSVFLELKAKDENQKKEIANSREFQELLKDFNKYVNVSSIVVQQQPQPQQPQSQQLNMQQPQQQQQLQQQQPPPSQQIQIMKPAQPNPYQQITSHPFYQQQMGSYNPFTQQQPQHPFNQFMNLQQQQQQPPQHPFNQFMNPQQTHQYIQPISVPTQPLASPPKAPNSRVQQPMLVNPFQQTHQYIQPLPQPSCPPSQMAIVPRSATVSTNTDVQQLPFSSPKEPLLVKEEEQKVEQPKLQVKSAKTVLQENLKQMFPKASNEIIEGVLTATNYNVEEAIESLLTLNIN